ncbi:unnamed protein product [Brassica rapa subsp. trilocularis]
MLTTYPVLLPGCILLYVFWDVVHPSENSCQTIAPKIIE